MEETVGPLDLCLPKSKVNPLMDEVVNGPLDLCIFGKSLDSSSNKTMVASDCLQSKFPKPLFNVDRAETCSKDDLDEIKNASVNEPVTQTMRDALDASDASITYHKGCFSFMDSGSLHNAHSSGDMQVCMICGGRFSTIGSLLLHMRGHIEVLECRDCGAYFTSEVKLSTHCQRNHSSNLWKCSVCCTEFSNLQDLDEHMRTHSQTVQFTFQLSNQQYFRYPIELNRELSFINKLSSRNSTKMHFENINSRLGNACTDTDGKFKCSDCGKTFARGRNVLIHRNYGRCPAKREAKVVFACSDCGKKFCSEKDLNEHKAEHFLKDGKGFPCHDCGKVFLRKTALHIHSGSRRCTGVQKEERSNNHCPECGIVFKFRAHLVEHMVKHTGERAFQCNGCGKWFARARNVKMHIQRGSCVGGFLSGKVSFESMEMASVNSHNSL